MALWYESKLLRRALSHTPDINGLHPTLYMPIQSLAKDILHISVTCVLATYVCLQFNHDTPSSVQKFIAESPHEAVSMILYQIIITTMFGNSALAWALAAFFLSVDNGNMLA